MQTYIYMRCSTDKQEFDRQLEVLKEHNIVDIPQENIYAEKISGTKGMDERVEFDKMLKVLEPGDTVVFESLSRVGRSLVVIFEIIDMLVKVKNVEVKILKENLVLSSDKEKNAMSNFMLNIFASIAQLERDLISERTKEALAAKKANGVALGRPTKVNGVSLEEFKRMYKEGLPTDVIAQAFGISRQQVNNIARKEKLPRRHKKVSKKN